LSLLLEEEKMEGVPLLVLANKQDLQNALPADEVGFKINVMFTVLVAVMQFNVDTFIS
jgi:ADP-ribosylation factor-like protein 3